MYHPTRGGTRGGQADFKWTDVKQDKDRENYLGHSINAPQGRWQNNQDIHWYSRDKTGDEAPSLDDARRARQEELRKIKEQEEDALAVALGFKPAVRDGADGEGTGANSVAVPKSEKQLEIERLEKEERKRAKELKRQQKEVKQLEKEFNREYKAQKKAERRAAGEHGRSERHRSRSPGHDRERDRHGSRDGQRERDDRNSHHADRSHRERDRSKTPEYTPDHRRERDHEYRSRHHGGSQREERRRNTGSERVGRYEGEDRRRGRGHSEDEVHGRAHSRDRERRVNAERGHEERTSRADTVPRSLPKQERPVEREAQDRNESDVGLTIKDEDD